MNKIIAFIMCVAFSVTMSGQTIKVEDRVKALEGDVKNLKGQLETQKCLIASMQSSLNELADRNAEYKKPLDIKQTLNTSDADGYQYSFVSAVGDKATGKLTLTLNLFNPGESREKQMAQAQFTDYAGNAYETNEYQFGNMENVKPTIDSNTNIKRKRIGIHVLPKKLSKGGGLLSFVSLLWKVANGLAIGFYNSPMVHWVAIGQSCQGCR